MIKHLFIIAGMIGVFMLISKLSVRSKQKKKRNIIRDTSIIRDRNIVREKNVARELNG
jgi:hypothetical protein